MPRRDTTSSRPSPPAPPQPRRAFAAALVLSLGGLVIAGLLVRVHVNAHAGLTSFCDLGAHMSCDTVALSRYSVVLGLPIAVWGALGYVTFAALSILGLRSTKPHPTWPAGLLFLLAAFSVAGSAVLAYLSEFVIRSFCIMCAASWAISLALLVVGWLACRGTGVGAAIARDLGVVRARPALAVAAAVALLAVAGVARASYPRYWERKPVATKPAPAPGATPAARTAPAPGSEVVIHEFSDFECPFCAIAHEDLKQLTVLRSNVRIVQRHFPLSSACNPALTRSMHEKACDYARAAICAEAMGKGDEMEDALFANQQKKEPLEDIVARLGLDRARFDACVTSQGTRERLAADVAEGMKLGVRATPTFVVNGQLYTGKLPEDVLR